MKPEQLGYFSLVIITSFIIKIIIITIIIIITVDIVVVIVIIIKLVNQFRLLIDY